MADEQDDACELLALMDEEDDMTEENEASRLEEEYLELEKKMREVREKMSKKKSIVASIITKQDSSTAAGTQIVQKSQHLSDEMSSKPCKQSRKSFFLTAMESSELMSSSNSCLDINNMSTNFVDRVSTSKRPPADESPTDGDNGLPPQKKRRIANISQTLPVQLSAHPMTESLRNSLSQQIAKPGQCHKSESRKQNAQAFIESEYFSRIRMKKCFVPSEEMQQRMNGKRFLKLGLIRSTTKISEDTDWVTIGVVSKQLDKQTTRNGKPFSIWHLTDLDDCTKTVAFFLFGAVHEKLTRQIAVGSVIGILNPSIMPPKKDETLNSFDNSPALTVDVAERVMHVGLSADLGWCTATKWRNKQPAGKCLAVVNKQLSDVCVFHMKSKYKKTSARRSELQGSVAAPVAKKYKNTLWNTVKNDQFFYGGKVYSATPSGKVENSNRSTEPKVKLSKFVQNHSNLTTDSLERSKVMNALGGIEGNHSLSGCSQAFADMISSGDNVAGARQFLNHLKNTKKKEEDMKNAHTRQQTAAEVLKEKAVRMKKAENPAQEEIKTPTKSSSLSVQLKMNSAKRKPVTPPSTNFVSPADIKKMTADIVKAKKFELSKTASPRLGSLGPKLGKGSSSDEIELFGDDWSSMQTVRQKANAETAKKKAIAKLRLKSGEVIIPKKDPNKGVLRQVENVRKDELTKANILKKVELNYTTAKTNSRSDDEIGHSQKDGSKFGSMTKEEFEKILRSESLFTREIETAQMEEQEKYFNPLIKKEIMEKKMAETFEVSCKVVTCAECSYTFWAPHERCKELQHRLKWRDTKKRFFQCSACKHRITTWEAYPSKPCFECGSEKKWHRTSMLKEKDPKILDSETLLIRGLEHGKFLNSLR